ncbi:phospholipase A1-like [Chrysoperla carnea]|uniref:phospholipase A1-like n=1 Tax=Chrysoperla carnea TaxID=189513 RepID=UPI001D06436E|nr:phospholipase A1-like [Chrysoperla carnea]
MSVLMGTNGKPGLTDEKADKMYLEKTLIKLTHSQQINRTIREGLVDFLQDEIRDGIHGDFLVINLRKLRNLGGSIAVNDSKADETVTDWNFYYMLKHGLAYLRDLQDMIPSSLEETLSRFPTSIQVNASEYVKLTLFTKSDPDTPYRIEVDTVFDAPFNVNHPSKIIIHGWLGDGHLGWLHKMKDKHFINGKYNVIIIDWDHFAGAEYPLSANNTQKVAVYVFEILELLIQAEKVRIDNIHFIGHSLGAHIAGMVGTFIGKKFGQKIPRITGLDPAMPNFESALIPFTSFIGLDDHRLDKSDAEFVDVIHTCSGILGYSKSFGHADFFPNNGTDQPGCTKGLFGILCHHVRAYELYTESINSRKFKSKQCESWKDFLKKRCKQSFSVSMGHYVDKNTARGTYYLETRDSPPYAMG